MHVIKSFLYIIASAILLSSCTKNFKEYNTNPNALPADQINRDNVYLGGFFKQMEESVFPVGGTGTDAANSYQLVENLTGDIFGGYHGMTHNWNAAGDNTTYNFNAVGWNAAAFNLFYNNVIKNYDTIKRYTVKNPDIFAVAKIIKVQAAHRTVDIYGPIPYFNTSTTLSTLGSPYNPVDSIYYSFFADLDSAIQVLKPYVQLGAKPLQYYDPVYRGNYAQWIKFANSLKLRLAMRIVYADPAKAKQYAEAAVNDPGGIITDNIDNAAMQGVQGVTYNNPLATLSDAYQEARMSANMQSFLSGYKDPRMARFFNTSLIATDPANTYRGIRNGIIIADGTKYQPFSSLQSNFNVIWMPAAEVYFLRAEGALRGWNMGGTAQQLYETGIQQSFTQWGTGSASNYITDAASKALPYQDPVNSRNNVAAGSELSTITIKWDNAAAFETALERIITQKWIAMYPNGQEAWSEFRRTHYPLLFTVVANLSGGNVDTRKQVKRLPYPSSEYQLNRVNVSRGITLLGGPDNGITQLWWDKKPY
ncbi:MAG TPA: RagB/SusD family nutrient uptake outer membrane protein [Chitinophaga sp.]|uniref:RagB/SusD family nutrient uptake outer membrane protein n=1 Tax=Chitinophaga sp. TaxID=1869181 RepID=UPI002CC7C2F4|nr:RagB/SusD family nutrient uptake outer membrane protein [Chitinophaga sp.]HVI43932.1 RagB/SusD family nutrient uptake outer membrane protein [Chitinophaga sp.]